MDGNDRNAFGDHIKPSGYLDIVDDTRHHGLAVVVFDNELK